MSKSAKPSQKPQEYEKSFAEVLVTDAFNPGVRPQSFDALNYSLIGLLIVGIVAVYLNGGNFHLIFLMILGGGLGILMNIYRQSFLDASEEYERKKAEEEAEEDDDEDDEDEEEEEEEGEATITHTSTPNVAKTISSPSPHSRKSKKVD